MDFRAYIYVGDLLKHVQRFTADDGKEALETARQEVTALGCHYADVWQWDGPSVAGRVGRVEADR
ncbi:hypothetical protein [Micromonospora sp. DPT]|uniref:hypothetical protein n=1 Tax=Micromonospora sp. DPT TaxID=3142975 RepID=UPI00320859B9